MRSLAALVALALLAGCHATPTAPRAAGPRGAGALAARGDLPSFPMKDMTARRKKAITKYYQGEFKRDEDKNGDGKLSPAEWKDNYHDAGAFKEADADKDGFLSFEEYLPTCQNAWENQIRTNMGGFEILLEQADRNHDGKIAGKELVYKPNQHRKTDYGVVDFNQDGEFSVDEYCDGYWNLMAGLKPAIPL